MSLREGVGRVGHGLITAAMLAATGLLRAGQWLGPRLVQAIALLAQIMRYVWRRLGLMFLGVLFVVPLLLSLAVAYGGVDGLDLPLLRMKQALWLSMSIVGIGLLWLVAWLICHLVVRLVRAAASGDKLGARTLSFAAVWIAFPALPKTAVLAVSWCVLQIAMVVPGNWLRLADPTVAARTAGEPPTTSDRPPAAPAPTGVGAITRGEPPEWNAQDLSERAATHLVLDVGAGFLTAADGELRRVCVGVRQRVSLSDLATATVAWMALVFVLSRMFRSVFELEPRVMLARLQGAGGRGARSLHGYLSRRWTVMGQNLAFLLILVSGAFLTLAAIICLPRLREANKPNSEVSVDALQSELQKLQITSEQLLVYLPEDLFRPPPATARLADVAKPAGVAAAGAGQGNPPLIGPPVAPPPVSTASAPAPETDPKKLVEIVADKKRRLDEASKNVNEHFAVLRRRSPDDGDSEAAGRAARDRNERYLQTLNELEALREKASTEFKDARLQAFLVLRALDEHERAQAITSLLVRSASQLRGMLDQEQARALADAVSTYRQENINRQGSREQVQHFMAIRDWFAQRVGSHRETARRCGAVIARVRSETSVSEARSDELLNRLLEEPIMTAIRQPESPDDDCSLEPYKDRRPPRSPELGESLGAFKPVAAWLLNADSLALALIAGLVGFGLLGSIISTFVRAQLEQQKASYGARSRPLVPDLTGVVLRGISAAVVVFLAVQGGLAVLSGAGAEPNPYVLLLACFVAAVFSERIWAKALDYLTESLGKIGSPDAPEPPTSPTAPPSLPPASSGAAPPSLPPASSGAAPPSLPPAAAAPLAASGEGPEREP